MIIKISDNYYNSTQEPILLILSEHEKECISNMGDKKKFCSFPDEYKSNLSVIERFMEVPSEIIRCVD